MPRQLDHPSILVYVGHSIVVHCRWLGTKTKHHLAPGQAKLGVRVRVVGSRLVFLSTQSPDAYESTSAQHTDSQVGTEATSVYLSPKEPARMCCRISDEPASSEPMAIMCRGTMVQGIVTSPTCLLWSSVLPACSGTQLLQATDCIPSCIFWKELFSLLNFDDDCPLERLAALAQACDDFLPFEKGLPDLDEFHTPCPLSGTSCLAQSLDSQVPT